jgi:RNA recognition motif-containing protein
MEKWMQGRTLYVGNLSLSLRKETLHELFSGYGSVLEVKIVGDNAFGFIEMSNTDEAENAKKSLNGHDLDGNKLKVDEARPKNYKRSGGFRRY